MVKLLHNIDGEVIVFQVEYLQFILRNFTLKSYLKARPIVKDFHIILKDMDFTITLFAL